VRAVVGYRVINNKRNEDTRKELHALATDVITKIKDYQEDCENMGERIGR
jgi:hypothetical protein